ncbi:MAG: hypothetical protein QW751_00015 [Candidatus Aenigmatarchaeota archaeon]
MAIERSKRVIFVAHCILNQNAVSVGRERAPGPIRELLELFAEAGVGIVQMPCPQLEHNGGLNRKPKPKEKYDTKSYRAACRSQAKLLLQQIQTYLSKDYNVLGILGVETSPTCAVHQLINGNRNVPGKGIFIEELENEMRAKNFQVPIIGVNLNNLFSTMEKLQSLLKYS